MKNKKTISVVLFAVIAIGGMKPKAAKANILAINEMKQELTILTQRHSEAKVNLRRAKTETKSLKRACSTLTKSIKLAIKSDEGKKAAEQASIESVGYGSKRNPYLADSPHMVGAAGFSSDELTRGTHY